MSTKRVKLGPCHVTTVALNDGREVCLSYGNPVAMRYQGRCMRTDKVYSVTSTRHALNFCAPDTASVYKHAVFLVLVAPITERTDA